jgi:hypothetical protein
MSAITTVKAFTSGKFRHTFTLVFADRTVEASGDYWQNREGWVKDLHSPDLLGVVGHPSSHKHPKFGVTVDRPDGRGSSWGSYETLDEAVQEVRTRHSEMAADVARRQVDPLYALECELKCHDWYYCMSDDGGVYRAGAAHWNKVAEMLKQVPVDDAKALWTKYAPEGFTCPV